MVSNDDQLRQVIEDNFNLALISIRDVAEGTAELRGQINDRLTKNEEQLRQVADRLEQAVEAIKTLAFSGADERRELTSLKLAIEELRSRVGRLEQAS